MKFFLDNVLLIGLALGSGLMLIVPWFTKSLGGAKAISPAQAVLFINREQAAVIDVRDTNEFASGHLNNALHIELASLENRLAELQKLKDKTIIVYCQRGVRSAKACSVLEKHAFTNVYVLEGGLEAWKSAKLPVSKEL